MLYYIHAKQQWEAQLCQYPKCLSVHLNTFLFCFCFFTLLLCVQASAAQEEIPPVPEPDIAPGKLPQPQTKSGCVIS